jgi:subtilisin family serine protease
VVKDNYDNIKDRFYGNSNISAGDVMHGTHVSGIIGAQRNNGLGMDGIADNVALMELRAVPDGDEHDKDIALAVRYAVNHGAKVINMSFGKPLSPQRKWVEDAFRYAQKHDVVLVHAAGNDGKDITNDPAYPTQFFEKDSTKSFDNMLTVGASGPIEQILIAEFSNFSPTAVDVFAPGIQIFSTLPAVNGKSMYGALDGTSMASPVVVGVAAVLRSYFPALTAPQVKQIIMQSVTPIDFPVMNPATGDDVSMKSLCASGGIVNLYNAVKLAKQMQTNNKPSSRKK